MINKIKSRIEQEIPIFLRYLDNSFALKKTSPLLFKSISDFVLRPGKRARPILFVIGFLGFGKKEPKRLYTSALSLELLHDFMLVHDDIIDKSELRRGKPAMHTALNHSLRKYRNIKFNGEDLAIVAGDVMYAMGLQAFLSVRTTLPEKEKSLKKLIDAAIFTGFGEFIELISSIKDISQITKEEIYKVYDFKTAYYTFAAPLAMGALLAGAKEKQADIVLRYGMAVGRAFQIKDDILGVFSEEKDIGKSVTTDIQEGKKTILIWHAYRHAGRNDRHAILKILGRNNLKRSELIQVRKIIESSGALKHAKHAINQLISNAETLLSLSSMKQEHKKILSAYTEEILCV